MAPRRVAAFFLATEKSYRRIMEYRDLWMHKAALNEVRLDSQEKIA